HQGLGLTDIAGIVFVSCAAPGFAWVFWRFKRCAEAKEVFVFLDRERRTLSLPRLGLILEDGEILRFIEVRGWCIERDRWGSEASWAREVSVVWRRKNGQLARSSVLISDGSRHVTRIGKVLAQFFDVDYRIVRGTWMPLTRSKPASPAR